MSHHPKIDQSRCLVVSKVDDQVVRTIETRKLDGVEHSMVRIRVAYSSLNFKDALCCGGHPGIARSFPLVPGIDAAGTVIDDPAGHFKAGEPVMVFHASFGTETDGGYSQIIDVPADWVYQIPNGLSARHAMILGTAGFTAAQCIDEIIKHNIGSDRGKIVVTGATGGVGICAVQLLAKLGYNVVAVTGKPERATWLQNLGASKVIGRSDVNDDSGKPMLSARWAAAVDTVGGNILSTIVRSTQPQGCVTACGLVGGTELNLNVYPFILRGVTLQGVDTAGISRQYRASLWEKLANQWSLDNLDELAIETNLDQIEDQIHSILAGQIAGRVIVKMDD